MTTYESPIVRSLRAGREVAWFALQPAFDHAIVVAKEAEHRARVLSDEIQQHAATNYPPIVELLAASVPTPDPAPEEVPF